MALGFGKYTSFSCFSSSLFPTHWFISFNATDAHVWLLTLGYALCFKAVPNKCKELGIFLLKS